MVERVLIRIRSREAAQGVPEDLSLAEVPGDSGGVAGTRMGQFYKLYFHASSTSTDGVISSLGISAGQ